MEFGLIAAIAILALGCLGPACSSVNIPTRDPAQAGPYARDVVTPVDHEYQWLRFKQRFLYPAPGCTDATLGCQTASECCSYFCHEGACAERSFGQGCGEIGRSCRISSECCSGSCAAGHCVGVEGAYCAYVGQSCSNSGQCCSGSCANGHCQGSAVECATVGQHAEIASQCCSDLLSANGHCLGGGRDPGRSGDPCQHGMPSTQCLSGVCESSTSTCR